MVTSFYRWHWNPIHAGHGVDGMFRDEQALFAATPSDIVKVITIDETIPKIDALPAGCKILVRYHPLSENAIGPAADQGRVLRNEDHARRVASTHADSMLRIAQWAESRGIGRDRLWFSGLNEQQFAEGGGREPYELGVCYWRELLRINHSRNLHTVIGEFGIGWPPDHGVKDSPVNFEPFRPAYEAMDDQDAWSYHAYWGGFGVEKDWLWLPGRMLQRPDWMHGKRLWLTECGSDKVPTDSPTKGWLTYPGGSDGAAQRYVGELAQFEKLYREADPDVEYAFIFTLDGNRNDWAAFEIEVPQFMRAFVPYVQSDLKLKLASQPVPPPARTLIADLQKEFGQSFEDLRASLPHSTDPGNVYQTRSEDLIRRVVIHHSAGPRTVGWQPIANYHVTDHGWPGIGYHIGIGESGKVSYLNDITLKTYHIGTYATPEDDNLDAIGICVLGNYEIDQPVPEMMDALKRLVAVLDRRLAGRQLRLIGHRDVGHDTECPGANLYPLIASLRNGTVSPAQPPDLISDIRVAALRQGGAVVPDGALFKFAVANKLGACLSPEYRQNGYLCQNYVRGIVYCVYGDWANVKIADYEPA